MGSDDASSTSFDLRIISIAVIITLIVGAGTGYMVGNSPIPGYKEEIDRLEIENIGISEREAQLLEEYTVLQDQLMEVKEDLSSTQSSFQSLGTEYDKFTEDYQSLYNQHENLKTEYDNLTEDYQSLYNQHENLKTEYDEYQVFYKMMWDKFDALIQDYNNLTFVDPVGEMIITEIPGIVNGDFESGFEGWVKQGKGMLLSGVRYLHQYTSCTFLTQTVTLESKNQGLSFWVKPAPVGADINLEVIIGNYLLYAVESEGQNIEFEWTKVVIPFKILFEMKEFYGFDIEGKYEIRFNIPAGDDNGAHIMLDNVSLVEISYQPEEPEPP